MSLVLWGIALVAGLYGLHRLALWMESRGWIYYKKKHASAGALSAAFLEIQALAQPEKKYVLEMRQDQRAERDHEGDSK
jgi:NADH:ubiquinone oxidoreductase subunit 4 (subunit M)